MIKQKNTVFYILSWELKNKVPKYITHIYSFKFEQSIQKYPLNKLQLQVLLSRQKQVSGETEKPPCCVNSPPEK